VSARQVAACVALVLLAAPLAGCARLVVIDPKLVPSRNSPDWDVRREPTSAAPADSRAP